MASQSCNDMCFTKQRQQQHFSNQIKNWRVYELALLMADHRHPAPRKTLLFSVLAGYCVVYALAFLQQHTLSKTNHTMSRVYIIHYNSICICMCSYIYIYIYICTCMCVCGDGRMDGGMDGRTDGWMCECMDA